MKETGDDEGLVMIKETGDDKGERRLAIETGD
jgi:hypothetical protein